MRILRDSPAAIHVPRSMNDTVSRYSGCQAPRTGFCRHDRYPIPCHGTASGHEHFPAKRLSDGLVPETNPKYGDFTRKCMDCLHRNSSLIRCARPRRDQELLRPFVRDFINRDLVIPVYLEVCTEFAEILHQVVGKRIVIVNDQYHLPPPRRARLKSPSSAILTARNNAIALFMHSWYSHRDRNPLQYQHRPEYTLSVLDNNSPDDNTGINVPLVVGIPYRAAVNPPAGGLELIDDLHCPDFRGA